MSDRADGDYVCKLLPEGVVKKSFYIIFDPFSSTADIDKATTFKSVKAVYEKYLSVFAFPEDHEKDITTAQVYFVGSTYLSV